MTRRVLLIGASVRAAAQSARRAGLEPWCLDLFADADLSAIAPVQAIAPADYPQGFLELLAAGPLGPVIYTGGLENHPELIDAISDQRPVWGHLGPTLRRVRAPERLASVLREAGYATPAIRLEATGLPSDGTWLAKPRRGSGGHRIEPWQGQPLAGQPGDWYWQERIVPPPGTELVPASALFVADAQGQVTAVGWCRQLVGQSWLRAAPFAFCGCVGPFPVSTAACDLPRLGQVLGSAFGLRGLFGVDFLVIGSQAVVLEVNPRYPASTEVYERVWNLALLRHHRAAFTGSAVEPTDELPQYKPSTRTSSAMTKAILFAAADCVFRRVQLAGLTESDRSQPVQLADLPPEGTSIAAGQPILTVLAPTTDLAAATVSEIECRLGSAPSFTSEWEPT